jgi:hypothetical protein
MTEYEDASQAPFEVGDEVVEKSTCRTYTVEAAKEFVGKQWLIKVGGEDKYWAYADAFMKTIKVSVGDVIITSTGHKLVCTARDNSGIAGYHVETAKFTQWDKCGNYVTGEGFGSIKEVHSHMDIADTPETEEKKYTLKQLMTALDSKFPNDGWDSTIAHDSLQKALDTLADPEYNEYIRLKAKFDTKKG